MPGGDSRGPAGFGPMTGRGMGYCAGSNMPGYTNRGFGFGRGMGFGRGRGRGFGLRHYNDPYVQGMEEVQPPISTDNEINMLKNRISYFEDSIKQMSARIESLKSSD